MYLKTSVGIGIESFTKLLNCDLRVISLKVYYWINLCYHKIFLYLTFFSDSFTVSKSYKGLKNEHFFVFLQVCLYTGQNYRQILQYFTYTHYSDPFNSVKWDTGNVSYKCTCISKRGVFILFLNIYYLFIRTTFHVLFVWLVGL